MLLKFIANFTLSLAVFLGFTVSPFALALSPTLSEFMRVVRKNRAGSAQFRMAASPALGVATFVPLKAVEGNQSRFAVRASIRKLNKSFSAEHTSGFDFVIGSWIFNHDRGRSFYPIKEHLRGIYYRGKIYLTDGHHRAINSAYFGAETVPMIVDMDVSERFATMGEFEKFMEREGYSYFRDAYGEPVGRVELAYMQDDPNLEYARRLLTRVDTANDKIKRIRGGDYATVFKIDRDIPFLEFQIADALTRAGLIREGEGRDFELEELERVSKILNEEAARPRSKMAQVLLLPKPELVANLDVKSLVREHRAKRCATALSTPAIPD